MKIFAIVKKVLDELYDEIELKDESQKDNRIQKEIEAFSSAYRKLGSKERPNFKYHDPIAQFAYVYKYVTAHANLVYKILLDKADFYQLFIDTKNKKEIIPSDQRENRIEIACLGGGPGSDMLGVVKFLQEKKWRGKLIVANYDKEDRAWSRAWSNLWHYADFGFSVSSNQVYFDAEIAESRDFKSLRKATLISMVYFISEIWHLRADLDLFFKNISQMIQPGTKVLYLDNNNFLDKPISREKKEVITLRNLFRRYFAFLHEEKGSRSLGKLWEEQKEDLGEYLHKFGQDPKLSADVEYLVLERKGNGLS